MTRQQFAALLAVVGMLALNAGCDLVPQRLTKPTLHNPFPELSSVAIVPFLNKSEEPTVNGREFAEAYYNELQQIPGFEIVSVSTVEETMRQNELILPRDLYKLGDLLGVDAVAVGAVNEFDMYYPPRCAIEVEWYSMNPCHHPIPPGYGLPWGTPNEEDIPPEVLFQAEMALARAQVDTQTPYPPEWFYAPPQQQDNMQQNQAPSGTPIGPHEEGATASEDGEQERVAEVPFQYINAPQPNADGSAEHGSAEPVPQDASWAASSVASPEQFLPPGMPPDWPDPRGFIPDGPRPVRPTCVPSFDPRYGDEPLPVLRHVAVYNGNDSEITRRLQDYYEFQDDDRIGGWQHYLRRSDDFIRLCCRMHIWEMLSSRGGAGEAKTVWKVYEGDPYRQ